MEIIEAEKDLLQIEETAQNEEHKTGLFSPNMLINSHKGEVYSIDFSKCGKFIASSSYDMTVMIHNVYSECETIQIFRGHKNAVLQVKWSKEENCLFSCSADKKVNVWDIESGQKVRSFAGHTGVVNSIDVININLISSCSDDGCIKFWDLRNKKSIYTINHEYPLLALRADKNGSQVFVSCVDCTIKSYDCKKYESQHEFKGHADYITGLDINHEETVLASLSADRNLICWDPQPFSMTEDRILFTLKAPKYNIDYNLIKLRFNNDNLLACGSGDNYLYIYDYKQKSLKYTLPGHKGTVNDVAFHPLEPIVATCSSDQTIFLGEL